MDEHSAQEDQYGYGEEYCEGYQSWDMEYEQEAAYSSHISKEEEILNMTRLLLEGQEKFKDRMDMVASTLAYHSQRLRIAATTHIKSINTEIIQGNEEQEDEDQTDDELQQEADEKELAALLRYIVDDNLEQRFEDACEYSLVVECMEDSSESSFVEKELSTKAETNMQLIPKKETKANSIEEASMEGEEEESPMEQPFAKYLGLTLTNEQSIENPWQLPFEEIKKTKVNSIEEASMEDEEEQSPMEQPFAKYLGLTLNNEESIDNPWQLPFEEIRMHTFGGWFYDEYEPGDTSLTKSN